MKFALYYLLINKCIITLTPVRADTAERPFQKPKTHVYIALHERASMNVLLRGLIYSDTKVSTHTGHTVVETASGRRGGSTGHNWELSDDGWVDKGLQIQRPSSVDTKEKIMCTWLWFQAGNWYCPSLLGSGRAQPAQHGGEKYRNMFFLYLPSLSDFLLGENFLAISQFICPVCPCVLLVSCACL